MGRSDVRELKITMADLWNNRDLEPILHEICTKYYEFRVGEPFVNFEPMIAAFKATCEQVAQLIHPAGMGDCVKLDPVFEGAQGLLLSQDNKENFPHVTRSYTGRRNVRELCNQVGINEIETYYISRTYLTKHGAGPLKGENPNLRYEDDTNVDHPWQGTIRFAPLDTEELYQRCAKDFGSSEFKLVLTHCDQTDPKGYADFTTWGTTRNDINPHVDMGKLTNTL